MDSDDDLEILFEQVVPAKRAKITKGKKKTPKKLRKNASRPGPASPSTSSSSRPSSGSRSRPAAQLPTPSARGNSPKSAQSSSATPKASLSSRSRSTTVRASPPPSSTQSRPSARASTRLPSTLTTAAVPTSLECPLCCQKFTDKSQLGRHLRGVHQVYAGPYDWIKNGGVTKAEQDEDEIEDEAHEPSSPDSLSDDENQIQSGLNCDFCGSEFSNGSTLLQHLKKFHFNQKRSPPRGESRRLSPEPDLARCPTAELPESSEERAEEEGDASDAEVENEKYAVTSVHVNSTSLKLTLKKHQAVSSSNAENGTGSMIRCGLCSQRFTDPMDLMEHVDLDHLRSNRRHSEESTSNQMQFDNSESEEELPLAVIRTKTKPKSKLVTKNKIEIIEKPQPDKIMLEVAKKPASPNPLVSNLGPKLNENGLPTINGDQIPEEETTLSKETNEGFIKCGDCKETFKGYLELMEHLSNSHLGGQDESPEVNDAPDEEDGFDSLEERVPSDCGQTSGRSRCTSILTTPSSHPAAAKRRSLNEESDAVVVKCGRCEESFEDHWSLMKHVTNVHLSHSSNLVEENGNPNSLGKEKFSQNKSVQIVRDDLCFRRKPSLTLKRCHDSAERDKNGFQSKNNHVTRNSSTEHKVADPVVDYQDKVHVVRKRGRPAKKQPPAKPDAPVTQLLPVMPEKKIIKQLLIPLESKLITSTSKNSRIESGEQLTRCGSCQHTFVSLLNHVIACQLGLSHGPAAQVRLRLQRCSSEPESQFDFSSSNKNQETESKRSNSIRSSKDLKVGQQNGSVSDVDKAQVQSNDASREKILRRNIFWTPSAIDNHQPFSKGDPSSTETKEALRRKDLEQVFSKCSECGDIFISQEFLSKHIKDVHQKPSNPTKPSSVNTPLEIKTFKCLLCGDSFLEKTELESHRSTKHGNKNLASANEAKVGPTVKPSVINFLKSSKSQSTDDPNCQMLPPEQIGSRQFPQSRSDDKDLESNYESLVKKCFVRLDDISAVKPILAKARRKNRS